MRVLHPPRGFFRGGPRDQAADNNSAVLSVEFGRTALLIPGDVRFPAERRLARLAPLFGAPDLLLAVPHHGSVHGSSRVLLESFNPSHAVISVGARNPFGHPHPAVLIRYADQGTEVWRTDSSGAVQAVSDGRRWKLGKAP